MNDTLILKELSRYPLGTFADLIYRNALLYPDQEAFVCGSHRIDFRQFNKRVNAIVHGLQDMGIQKGDVMGIISWNRLEYPEVFGAAMKGGFVLAHFSPRLKPHELEHLINDSRARVLFFGPEFQGPMKDIQDQLSKTQTFVSFGESESGITGYRDLLDGHPTQEPRIEIRKKDPLVIFYTSGTTGIPKGAVYNQEQKMQNTQIKALDL
ncbi:MAG: AMP-binding protein, partial [Deltaproteobacteria bacterium]|nr:AMP-binding protein [Deltaproteobacteria bacterium]